MEQVGAGNRLYLTSPPRKLGDSAYMSVSVAGCKKFNPFHRIPLSAGVSGLVKNKPYTVLYTAVKSILRLCQCFHSILFVTVHFIHQLFVPRGIAGTFRQQIPAKSPTLRGQPVGKIMAVFPNRM